MYGASFLWFQVSQFAEKPAEHTQVYQPAARRDLTVNLHDDGSATSNFKCLSVSAGLEISNVEQPVLSELGFNKLHCVPPSLA